MKSCRRSSAASRCGGLFVRQAGQRNRPQLRHVRGCPTCPACKDCGAARARANPRAARVSSSVRSMPSPARAAPAGAGRRHCRLLAGNGGLDSNRLRAVLLELAAFAAPRPPERAARSCADLQRQQDRVVALQPRLRACACAVASRPAPRRLVSSRAVAACARTNGLRKIELAVGSRSGAGRAAGRRGPSPPGSPAAGPAEGSGTSRSGRRDGVCAMAGGNAEPRSRHRTHVATSQRTSGWKNSI